MQGIPKDFKELHRDEVARTLVNTIRKRNSLAIRFATPIRSFVELLPRTSNPFCSQFAANSQSFRRYGSKKLGIRSDLHLRFQFASDLRFEFASDLCALGAKRYGGNVDFEM